jgi:hypothetical protein
VYTYVGEEVIASWLLAEDAARNARAVGSFFAIERKMAALRPGYLADFGIAPSFRAAIHTGPVIVSEFGDASYASHNPDGRAGGGPSAAHRATWTRRIDRGADCHRACADPS